MGKKYTKIRMTYLKKFSFSIDMSNIYKLEHWQNIRKT